MTSHPRLTVQVREADTEGSPGLVGLLKASPSFEIDSRHGERTYVAQFEDLAESIDLVVQLIGDAINLPKVRVTVNDRPVAKLAQFWSALICYAESLREPAPKAYCLRKSARLSSMSGCPDRTCLSHCQFLCTRCLAITCERGAPPVSWQLQELARQAEVDWCPNLHLPGR